MITETTEPGDPAQVPPVDLQTETRDLKQLVRLALRRRKRSAGTAANPLLFLAPEASVLPVAVIEDTALSPVDKLVWMTLRIRHDRSPGERTLPSNTELARSTRIATRDTIATALAMLRCRRYLSVCATAWHGGGRKVGMAYALHATRLPMVDTIFLDPGYASYLEDLATHSVRRVRDAAKYELSKLPV